MRAKKPKQMSKRRKLTTGRKSSKLWQLLRDNGLSLMLGVLFLVFLIGHSFTGWSAHNDEERQHGQPEIGYVDFVTGPEFGETVFENWESEFLQMGAFVLLTVMLRQRGSAESKDPDKPHEDVDESPEEGKRADSPWPVRYGGLASKLYSHSLGLAFIALFAFSFVMHAVAGAKKFNEEQLQHGGETVSVLGYTASSQFWYESFQNWQSEFLAVFSMVVLSVFLRQKGSAESKPVAAPHGETGKG